MAQEITCDYCGEALNPNELSYSNGHLYHKQCFREKTS